MEIVETSSVIKETKPNNNTRGSRRATMAVPLSGAVSLRILACLAFLFLHLPSVKLDDEKVPCPIDIRSTDYCDSKEYAARFSYAQCGKIMEDVGGIDKVFVDMRKKEGIFSAMVVDLDSPTPEEPYLGQHITHYVNEAEVSDGTLNLLSGTQIFPFELPKPLNKNQYFGMVWRNVPDINVTRPKSRNHFDVGKFIAESNLCPSMVFIMTFWVQTGPVRPLPPPDRMADDETEDPEVDDYCPIDFLRSDMCHNQYERLELEFTCDVLFQSNDKVINKPSVKMNASEENMYIVFMLDPDSPRPDYTSESYRIHWITYDVQGSSFKSGEITGTVAQEYIAPAPLIGIHRYHFLVFEQPDYFDYSDLKVLDRERFDLQTYVEHRKLCEHFRGSFQYRLTLEPIGVTNAVDYPLSHMMGMKLVSGAGKIEAPSRRLLLSLILAGLRALA